MHEGNFKRKLLRGGLMENCMERVARQVCMRIWINGDVCLSGKHLLHNVSVTHAFSTCIYLTPAYYCLINRIILLRSFDLFLPFAHHKKTIYNNVCLSLWSILGGKWLQPWYENDKRDFSNGDNVKFKWTFKIIVIAHSLVLNKTRMWSIKSLKLRGAKWTGSALGGWRHRSIT